MSWREFERAVLKSSTVQLSHQLRGLVSPRDMQDRLRAEINLYDRWRRDPGRPVQFQAAVPVPNARAADYRLRLVSTPAGRVLAGIRFLSGDVNAPFVQIYARDHSLRAGTGLAASLRKILAEFSAFAAKRIRVQVPVDLEFGQDVCERIDFVTFAGLTSEMASGLPPSPRVRVCRAADPQLYDFYDLAYRQHHAENQQLAKLVQPLDREDFDDAFQKGEIYQILLDGEQAGLLVLRPAYRDGMRGFLLVDEVVAIRNRGIGLATTAQRMLAGRLRDPRRQIMFGTIAPENVGSLRTAEKAGRIAVSKCCFLVPLTP